jgi:hypothetical protein
VANRRVPYDYQVVQAECRPGPARYSWESTDPRFSDGRFEVTLYAVRTADREWIEAALTSTGLDALCRWIKRKEAALHDAHWVWSRSDQRFVLLAHDGHLTQKTG